MSDSLEYGWFTWRPKSLQTFNKAVWVLVFLSIGNGMQSMIINGLLGVVLSTIERRFELSSSQSSWIASAYEVATVPMLLLFSYIGTKIHRMRAVSLGFIGVALGCILFYLPHVLTPAYYPSGEGDADSTCRDRSNETICEEDTGPRSLSSYMWFFIVARLLHGIGATPVYILGVTYLDDIVSKETFSLYIAIFYSLGVVGPAVGVIGAGYLLTVYTDFSSVDLDDILIQPGDPRWVGAWWIGFLIGAVLCVIITLPLSGYSKDLPGAEAIRAAKVSEAYNDTSSGTETEIKSLKDLPRHLKVLFSNPTFLLLSLFISCDGFIIAGFTAFGPKYVENQYALTAAKAGGLFGIVLLPAGAIGTISGGAIIKRFNLSCSQIMKIETIMTVVILMLGFIFFTTCDQLNFAGVNIDYVNKSTDAPVLNLTAACNIDCQCGDVPFEPICSHDNVRYYSPCHAGCINETMVDDVKEYLRCECIEPPSSFTMPAATSNPCTSAEDCVMLAIFLTLFFCETVMIFISNTMNISATVRSVPAAQRSMAIGFQWITLRLLGTIPGPVAFGSAFDGACILWQESCGERGSCLMYDRLQLSLYLFAVCIGIKLASLVFVGGAWFFYKPPRISSSTEEITPDAVSTSKDKVSNETDGVNMGYVANGGLNADLTEVTEL